MYYAAYLCTAVNRASVCDFASNIIKQVTTTVMSMGVSLQLNGSYNHMDISHDEAKRLNKIIAQAVLSKK